MDTKLKFDTHTVTQANKANRVLGLIRRTFDNLDEEMLVLLYNSPVSPSSGVLSRSSLPPVCETGEDVGSCPKKSDMASAEEWGKGIPRTVGKTEALVTSLSPQKRRHD